MGGEKMKTSINGKIVELTEEETIAIQTERAISEAIERTNPLTMEEVLRLVISQQVGRLDIDDATASRMVEYFPELTGNGSLVSAGTRINWGGEIKRAAVDLWDTAENNPDNAPTLWDDIQYRNGYRIIPETITVGTAFGAGEYGWWGDVLYRSKTAANVYTPDQYPENWEEVTT